MDKQYELRGIWFTWDQNKNRTNVARHGVSFERAAEIWFDPTATFAPATTGRDANEALVGHTLDWTARLFVVHIEVEDDFIRIISARKAQPHE